MPSGRLLGSLTAMLFALSFLISCAPAPNKLTIPAREQSAPSSTRQDAPATKAPPKEPRRETKSKPQPRDHGPPPAFEEWTVVDEQRLEHKEGIWHAAITSDGKTLATTSGKVLRLWDLSVNPPREKASMKMPVGRSMALRFSPDGKTLFLAAPDHTLRLLDVTAARISERLKMNDWTANVWSVRHAHDGKTMAVGSDDMTVWLYDVTGDKPRKKKVFRADINTSLGVKQLFFTADDKRLILGTGQGAVRLWDMAAKQPKELAAKDGESQDFSLPMALSPDGKVLAVAHRKTVHLLDVFDDGFAEWMKLPEHTHAIWAVNFSPDGKLLATTGKDGKIMVWKVGLDKPILVETRAGAYSEVLFVPQSKDVRLIACNWNTGQIYLFKLGKE